MSDPYLYHSVQLERRGFFKAWSIYGLEAIEVAPESPDMDCSRRRIRTDFASRGSSRTTQARSLEVGKAWETRGSQGGHDGAHRNRRDVRHIHVWLVRVSNCFEKCPGTLVS